jgi:membrane protein
LVALIFTLAGFAAFLLAMAAVVVLPLILLPIGLGSLTETLTQIGRWPVLLVVLLVGLALLYRYGPHRRVARWQWVSVGSVFAAVTCKSGRFGTIGANPRAYPLLTLGPLVSFSRLVPYALKGPTR